MAESAKIRGGGPHASDGKSYQEALAWNRANVRNNTDDPFQRRPSRAAVDPTDRIAGHHDPGHSEYRPLDGVRGRSWSFKTKMIFVAGIAGVGLAVLLQVRQQEFLQAGAVRASSTAASPWSTVQGLGLSSGGTHAGAASEENTELACDPYEELKTMGTQWLTPGAYGTVPMTIRNKSNQIAFVDMRVVGTMDQATTLVIMPGEAIRFPLAGKGAVGSISVGSIWCNRQVGWKDGRRSHLRPAMIPSRDTTEVRAILIEKAGGLLGARLFAEKPDSPAPAHFQ